MALARAIRQIYYSVRSGGERALVARESRTPEAPKPRFLDRVREAIRARHYSHRTERPTSPGYADTFFSTASAIPQRWARARSRTF
jgi:hypothetical protein